MTKVTLQLHNRSITNFHCHAVFDFRMNTHDSRISSGNEFFYKGLNPIRMLNLKKIKSLGETNQSTRTNLKNKPCPWLAWQKSHASECKSVFETLPEIHLTLTKT